MNLITSNASSAIAKCRRFIQFQISHLKGLGFTQQIQNSATRSLQGVKNIGSDLRFYLSMVIYYLTGAVLSGLEPFRGSKRAASRRARLVALAIGISLCLPMSHASSGSIDAIDPKDYIRFTLDKKEAICLSRLIGKESAWNTQAVGNLNSPTQSYTYGLLQLKNPIVKDKDAITQIHYGLRYIKHRYEGDTCKAWTHWVKRGWH